jgi:hypothetical protein
MMIKCMDAWVQDLTHTFGIYLVNIAISHIQSYRFCVALQA